MTTHPHLPWDGGNLPPGYPADACGICGRSTADHRNVADAYRAAAAAVAAARIRYAESFLLWKQRGSGNTSDEKARQHAVIDTGDELTTLLTELEIAKEAYRQS